MPFGLTIGTERATALQQAIQDELLARGYSQDSDPVMAEYILIMIINNKTATQITGELDDLIGPDFAVSPTGYLLKQQKDHQRPSHLWPLRLLSDQQSKFQREKPLLTLHDKAIPPPETAFTNKPYHKLFLKRPRHIKEPLLHVPPPHITPTKYGEPMFLRVQEQCNERDPRIHGVC
ncbi:hypothetical protein MPER_11780 [Moniliophthora perniciosa FA553]|nr:hypothetical protein MPER_11780 [Moniliophthora perniciosa FA553]